MARSRFQSSLYFNKGPSLARQCLPSSSRNRYSSEKGHGIAGHVDAPTEQLAHTAKLINHRAFAGLLLNQVGQLVLHQVEPLTDVVQSVAEHHNSDVIAASMNTGAADTCRVSETLAMSALLAITGDPQPLELLQGSAAADSHVARLL